MASVDENLGLTRESILSYCKTISDRLSDSGMKSLLSLIHVFKNERITLSVLRKSVHLLFHYHKDTSEQLRHSGMESLLSLIDAFRNEGITDSVFSKSIDVLLDNNHVKTRQDSVEEGEIRDHRVCAVRGNVDDKPKKSGVRFRIRVNIEKNPREDVSEGKKRRILHAEQIERTAKRQRKSRGLDRVTPCYKLIPEEEQCPVSDDPVLNCLNTKYSVMQFDGASRPKKLSKYEEEMERCEDDMFETDVLMGSLESAVESAENVMKEKMGVEDLGVKFYRSIEMLYRGDMSEIVREDHKKALPVILNRLKQKLDELKVARESWKPRWKKVFEENTAKQQREATRKH